MGVLEYLIMGLIVAGWALVATVFGLEVRRGQQEERDTRKKK
jgi:hypothetical protein